MHQFNRISWPHIHGAFCGQSHTCFLGTSRILSYIISYTLYPVLWNTGRHNKMSWVRPVLFRGWTNGVRSHGPWTETSRARLTSGEKTVEVEASHWTVKFHFVDWDRLSLTSETWWITIYLKWFILGAYVTCFWCLSFRDLRLFSFISLVAKCQ